MTRRRTGFTLLELVLAMGLMAMLSVTLYSSLRTGLKARDSAANATEPTRRVALIAGMVRQDLESVPPPTGTLAGQFIGMPDAVQFCTIGMDDLGDDSPLTEGVRRVELMLTTSGTSRVLMRRVQRNLMPSLTAQYEEEILARDVVGFVLKYFDGSTWQESWDSATYGDVLPMAVVVTIQFQDPTRPDGPPRSATSVIPLACGKLGTPTLGGL